MATVSFPRRGNPEEPFESTYVLKCGNGHTDEVEIDRVREFLDFNECSQYGEAIVDCSPSAIHFVCKFCGADQLADSWNQAVLLAAGDVAECPGGSVCSLVIVGSSAD